MLLMLLLQELTQPAYAHAGMVAAAKAIFEDMKERGILQQVGRFPTCICGDVSVLIRMLAVVGRYKLRAIHPCVAYM